MSLVARASPAPFSRVLEGIEDLTSTGTAARCQERGLARSAQHAGSTAGQLLGGAVISAHPAEEGPVLVLPLPASAAPQKPLLKVLGTP